MPLTKEQKDELINNLIEGVDGDSPWTEDDRMALNAIPETKLEALERQRKLALNAGKIPPQFLKKKEAKTDEDYEDDEEMEDEEEEESTENEDHTPAVIKKPAKAPTANAQPRTTKEWLDAAPPEVRSVVTNAMRFESKQKEKLIKSITANERNVFSDEYLATRSLDELQAIAALAVNEEPEEEAVTPKFGYPLTRQPVTNEGFEKEDLDMAPVSIDWQ